MIVWAELWFKVSQWFVRLKKDKALLAVMSVFIGLIVFENYRLREDNQRLTDNHSNREHRTDSILDIANKRLQECNDKRQSDLEEANKYWSDKVEKLEDRLYEDFKTIKQIRRK